MTRLTESLVLRPTAEQAKRLASAVSLERARAQWVCTLLIAVTSFVALRQLHIGPIRSLMGSVSIVAALATSLAPRMCRAFLTQGVLTLRAAFLRDAIQGRRKLIQVAAAYRLLIVGIWSSVAGYNLLALSILLAHSTRPLESFFPAWPSTVALLIAAGWAGLLIGERRFLRELAR